MPRTKASVPESTPVVAIWTLGATLSAITKRVTGSELRPFAPVTRICQVCVDESPKKPASRVQSPAHRRCASWNLCSPRLERHNGVEWHNPGQA